MARCWEASNKPKPWAPRHGTGFTHQCGEGTLMYQMLGQMVGAHCLAQRALIKDMLMGTQSQEAPYGGGVDLLGGLTSSLGSKT